MRIDQILGLGKPGVSFEFFPPKTEAGFTSLFKTIDEQQHEKDTNFKRIPDNLTVAQAYDLARKQQAPSAKSQSGD